MGTPQLSGGRFITFEGGEGAGKSTQLRRLVEKLSYAGIAVLATREPGGSPAAEEIRRLLVEGATERWDAESEALLMVAARRCHLTTTIWPALDQGRWVICDRFVDSTLAYQGYGRGVRLDRLLALHRFIAGDFMPDLTLILDLPVEIGLARAARRKGKENRFERMDAAFHARMRQGFIEIARGDPKRCVIIDADAPEDEIHRTVVRLLRERLAIDLPV